MRLWLEKSRWKRNCPLIRGVRLLECPLIGERTIYLTGIANAGNWIKLNRNPLPRYATPHYVVHYNNNNIYIDLFFLFLATVTLVAGMVISFLDPTLTPFIKTLDVRIIYCTYVICCTYGAMILQEIHRNSFAIFIIVVMSKFWLTLVVSV